MKYALFLSLTLGVLAGCGQGDANQGDAEQEEENANGGAESEISGYVMDEEDDEILVVAEESRSTEGDGEQYEAVWFADAPEEAELGEKITVEYGDVQDSYPAQSSVEEYEIIEPESTDGANLTETEVLNEILPVDDVEVPVAAKLAFDSESNQWNIEIVDGVELMGADVDEEVIDFEVEDK